MGGLRCVIVQAALFYARGLQPVHFWVLTLFNWSCLFALPYAIHTAYFEAGMNQRSVLVGIVVGIGVFYALLTGDFVIILMSVVAGYVIHTLLG